MKINVTDKALEMLKKALDKENTEVKEIRIYVKGIG